MRKAAAPSQPFWDRAIETMAREGLERLQLERLQWQLARCYDGSPLYREKLDAVAVVPSDIRALDDLARLPVVTKDELRADQQRTPPFGTATVAPTSAWRELHPSSGTTGAPVNVVWSANDVATITSVTARTLWQFGARPGDVIQNAFSYGLWVAGLSAHYAASAVGALVIPIGTGVATERQIDYLVRARATVLLATPSYALHIAEELAHRGIGPDELALRLGCFGGEAGTENPPTRAALEAGLGIDAFDYYGLAEIGPTFASECPAKSGLHFADDHVLVECVDPETKTPVSDGELGVLVFTHLTREASPMIRYWSNDYARITREPCSCGRRSARAIGGILGRHDDLVVFRGAKFYPSQVEKVVRALPELSPEFRIEVERGDGDVRVRACTVVVEQSAGGAADVEERLKTRLRAELGVTPAIRFVPHGSLERTAFKAVRLVVR